MSQGLVPISPHQVSRAGLQSLPNAITGAGERASWRFIEFFTANIRNRNTRAAYAQAVSQFFRWCEAHHIIALEDIRPVVISAYVEDLASTRSAPTVKQHLAAVKVLFDWLVIGQVLPMNPASSVRGPKHVTKRGKTPVLTADQARHLLDSINVDTIIGLRDRAMIGLMCYTFARVSAT